jgi:hypothetical protein
MRQRIIRGNDVLIDTDREYYTSLKISIDKIIRYIFFKIHYRSVQSFGGFHKLAVKPVNNIFKFGANIGVFGRYVPSEVFLGISFLS